MYATPVAARRTPDGFAIPLPWGAETDWCRNVLADGSCEIRWSGINYATDSPIVVDAERALSALRPIERRIARAVGIHRFLLVRARGT